MYEELFWRERVRTDQRCHKGVGPGESVVSYREKTYRTARAGDLGVGSAQKLLFQKPYVQGFPDSC
jgi:hypothetical protein